MVKLDIVYYSRNHRYTKEILAWEKFLEQAQPTNMQQPTTLRPMIMEVTNESLQ